MNNPILLVVAGCNGSGKSSYSNDLTPDDVIPFDYDYNYMMIHSELLEIDIKDEMAHRKTRALLDQKVEEAIKRKTNFCYETNFNSTPMFWPNHFKENRYEINMFFFCLDSIEEAKRRVTIRVENGGHFVPPDEIERRYYLGYKNLNKHFHEFNNVHLYNTSYYNEPPRHLMSIRDGVRMITSENPKFISELLPDISIL